MSRSKPSPPSLKTRVLALGLALAFALLGAGCAWLIADDVAHGRIEARHGLILWLREPVVFAIEFTIRGTATAGVLAAAAWLVWAATLAPPGVLRGREELKR